MTEHEVNEAYAEYLSVLNRKADAIKSAQSSDETVTSSDDKPAAVQDIEPYLNKLCLKAAARVRVFLLQKIADLKKPKTNTQFLKQTVIMKFKHFQSFLDRHHPESGNEVRLTYVDTISKYYFQSFRTYITQIQRIEQKTVSSKDVIVEQVASTFSLFGSLSPTKAQSRKGTIRNFSLFSIQFFNWLIVTRYWQV